MKQNKIFKVFKLFGFAGDDVTVGGTEGGELKSFEFSLPISEKLIIAKRNIHL